MWADPNKTVCWINVFYSHLFQILSYPICSLRLVWENVIFWYFALFSSTLPIIVCYQQSSLAVLLLWCSLHSVLRPKLVLLVYSKFSCSYLSVHSFLFICLENFKVIRLLTKSLYYMFTRQTNPWVFYLLFIAIAGDIIVLYIIMFLYSLSN